MARAKTSSSVKKTPTRSPRKSTADAKVTAPVAQADAPTTPMEVATPTAPMLRRKELIDTVVARSGIKKKDAKPVVEAMLAVMGAALQEGRDLNVPPFGNLKVRRTKDMPNARVLTAKLRQRKPGTAMPSASYAATDAPDTAVEAEQTPLLVGPTLLPDPVE